MDTPTIEAFGSPAVGKSYVIKHLARHVEGQGERLQREPYSLVRRDRIARVLRKTWLLASQLPGLLPHIPAILRLLRQCAWESRAGAFKALFNWLLVMASLRHLRRASDPVLLSQGAFQAIWSLAYRARADGKFPLGAWVNLTLSIIPDRTLVVLLITAGPDTVTRRISTRTEGQSVLDHHRDAGAMDRAQHIIDDLTQFIEVNAAKGNLRLVVHDNGADRFSEQSAARLAHDLGLLESYPVHTPEKIV